MNYELSLLKEICSKYDEISKASLFGSRATGYHDLNSRSDFDIAIYCNKDINLDFYEEIDNIDSLLAFDITYINDKTVLEQEFLDNLKKEEVFFYMGKFENKYQNLIKVIQRLKEVVEKSNSKLNVDDYDIYRDSIIKRFELCYEQAWKTLKDYLSEVGIQAESTPRSVFKASYQNQIINNQDLWLNMIKDRNLTTHQYSENYVDDIAVRVKQDYLPELEKLVEKLKP